MTMRSPFCNARKRRDDGTDRERERRRERESSSRVFSVVLEVGGRRGFTHRK